MRAIDALRMRNAAPPGYSGPIYLVNESHTGAASVSNVAPSWPAGLQLNDIALLHVYMNAAGTVTFTTPTGWTLAQSTSFATNDVVSIFWKRLDGTESGTVTVSASTTGSLRTSISLWRGCLTSGTPYESATGTTKTTFNNSISSPSRSIAGTNRAVLNFYSFVDNDPTVTVGTGYSQAYSWSFSSASHVALDYKVLTAAGTESETGGSLSASSRYTLIYLNLIPA